MNTTFEIVKTINLIEMSKSRDFINNIQIEVQKAHNEIDLDKENIIKERLANILGHEVDLEKLYRRRFSKLLIEHTENYQTIWYNDGSETGLRVVSFENPIQLHEDKHPHIDLLHITMKYY
jgi:hypothetical protein